MSEYEAVILPIYGKENTDRVNAYVREIASIVTGSQTEIPVRGEYFRAYVGDETKTLIDFRNIRLGEKIAEWEISGYPQRIECGERDIDQRTCVVASRITGEKKIVPLDELQSTLALMAEVGQKALLEKSRVRLRENTVPCKSLEDIGEAVNDGKFALYEWDKNPTFEQEIKDRFKATTRCIPFEGQFTDTLLTPEKSDTVRVIVARNF